MGPWPGAEVAGRVNRKSKEKISNRYILRSRTVKEETTNITPLHQTHLNTIIRTIGVSVSSGNMELLEQLTIAPEKRATELARLQKALGVEELLYLATCNRVEFIVATTEEVTATDVRNRLLDFFFSSGRDINFQPSDLKAASGASAVRHVFRVVSALESVVIGETQITGQFKAALQDGLDLGLVGARLEPFAKESLQVARQVRNETDLGRGSVSMASLVMDELSERSVITPATKVALVGSGEMTVKVATYLKTLNVTDILFTNRTVSKAQALAERFNGRAICMEGFLAAPPEVDVIVSATSAPEPIFGERFLSSLKPHQKKVHCVDLAIPRDFAEIFAESEKAELIDIPLLQSKRDTNLHKKFREVDKAGEIVEIAVGRFQRSHIERTIRPALKESYQVSMEFAMKTSAKLLETHLADYPPELSKHIESLMRKVVGFSSAQFGHAVAAHLSHDAGDHMLTEMCEEAKRECFPEGQTEQTDKSEQLVCPVKKVAHA